MNENERNDYLVAFGRRVRYYREKLGMTQKELGVRAGYTDGTNPSASISKIELGQMDVTQTKCAELAADLLGVPCSTFCSTKKIPPTGSPRGGARGIWPSSPKKGGEAIK